MNSTNKALIVFPSLYLIVVLLLTCLSSAAQQSDSLAVKEKTEITMKNGDKYEGIVISEDSDFIVLQTENGEVKLIKANILQVERYSKTGKFTFDNPHYTRYFFGPSAMPLGKGDGYYQNLMLTTNFFNVGITNNLSLGGGFEFISLFLGKPIWFFTPKAGFEVGKNMYAGGGAFVAGMMDEGSVALLYGAGTFGTKDNSISLGVGYGLAQGELTQTPAIMLSGVARTSRKTSLLSENYLIPAAGETFYLGIHGIRLMTRESAFDLGGIVIPELPFPIPFVGFATMF
jgi:hypothetical protein